MLENSDFKGVQGGRGSDYSELSDIRSLSVIGNSEWSGLGLGRNGRDLVSRGDRAGSCRQYIKRAADGHDGYKNVMVDIGTLASILRKHAARVADRTSVKPQELSAAEDLANQLSKSVGLREQAPQMIDEAVRTGNNGPFMLT